MNITIYFEGDEVLLLELPDNTKEVDFNFSSKLESNQQIIKRIEFYPPGA